MPFPLDIKYINATAKKISRRLPHSYVEAMCQDNGGSVQADGDWWELHPILDESSTKRLSRTCNDIVRETEASREWSGFHDDALAIGTNGSGDRLVFLTKGDSYSDKIYRWDHETGNVEVVADDFSEFEKD